MSAGGSKYWSILINRLSLIGSIDVVDDIAISILCESLNEYFEMTHFLAENGRTYEFTNAKNETSVRARPEVRIQNDCWSRIYPLLKEFGLTFKSRNNMTPIPLKQTESVWGALRK